MLMKLTPVLFKASAIFLRMIQLTLKKIAHIKSESKIIFFLLLLMFSPRRTTAEQEVLALIAPLGKLIVTH